MFHAPTLVWHLNRRWSFWLQCTWHRTCSWECWDFGKPCVLQLSVLCCRVAWFDAAADLCFQVFNGDAATPNEGDTQSGFVKSLLTTSSQQQLLMRVDKCSYHWGNHSWGGWLSPYEFLFLTKTHSSLASCSTNVFRHVVAGQTRHNQLILRFTTARWRTIHTAEIHPASPSAPTVVHDDLQWRYLYPQRCHQTWLAGKSTTYGGCHGKIIELF